MSSSFRWDYSKIKNFPEGCTIQKMGKHLYVIERKCGYSPAEHRSVDRARRTVGQVVNNVFYTSEEYKAHFQRGMKPRETASHGGEQGAVAEPARCGLVIEKVLFERSEALFAELGLSLETAVEIFLRKSLAEGGLPFAVKREPRSGKGAKARAAPAGEKAAPAKRSSARRSQAAGDAGKAGKDI